MNRTNPQRPRRTVTILKVVSAVLSLAFWIASCLLWYHYAVTRPSQPDAAVGRIYAERQIEQPSTSQLPSARSGIFSPELACRASSSELVSTYLENVSTARCQRRRI